MNNKFQPTAVSAAFFSAFRCKLACEMGFTDFLSRLFGNKSKKMEMPRLRDKKRRYGERRASVALAMDRYLKVTSMSFEIFFDIVSPRLYFNPKLLGTVLCQRCIVRVNKMFLLITLIIMQKLTIKNFIHLVSLN